jgi:hypothetical protein
LDKILFAQVLAIIPHLSSSGLSGMVYEHYLGCFIPKGSSLRFSKLFQIVTNVTRGDISRSVALVLRVIKLLAMAKDIADFCLIVIGVMFP